MTIKNKGILISAIINYLGENVKKKNHKLASENLLDPQEKFDAGDMFFKLAFMSDSEVERIATLILG